MSHYFDVKNYGRIIKHDDYSTGIGYANQMAKYKPTSIPTCSSVGDGVDIFDTDRKADFLKKSSRRSKVKTMYKRVGHIQYNFVHPYHIKDMFDYLYAPEAEGKFNPPEEFGWFYVESIDIAVRTDDTKTFTYERGIDTVLQAAHYSLGAHARYEHTFKGLYSRKEGDDDISFVNSRGEVMKINKLGTFGSGTDETYRGYNGSGMIATPVTQLGGDHSLTHFPPTGRYGLFGGLTVDGIKYTHPNFYAANSLIGYGGSVKQNVAGGNSKFNRVSGEYNNRVETGHLGEVTRYPQLDIKTNQSLDLLLNHQLPSITNVLSSNEESEYQLANKNYEQGLEQQQTFSTMLDFATTTGGFFLVGFWIKTFLSLGSLIMHEIDKKAREEDAKNNFDDGKIPHAVKITNPGAFFTKYESYYRNTLPYTYSVDFINYKQTKTNNKHRRMKKPFVTIPINKLAKSSEELQSIISEHIKISRFNHEPDISYRFTVKPYMNTEYGRIVSDWSNIIFYNEDVKGTYVSNWIEADKK